MLLLLPEAFCKGTKALECNGLPLHKCLLLLLNHVLPLHMKPNSTFLALYSTEALFQLKIYHYKPVYISYTIFHPGPRYDMQIFKH